MSDSSAAWLSGLDIQREVGAGRLDPQAVAAAQLDRIERLDPSIHAYVYVDGNARSASGPAAGVTLAVKDNQPVAGMPWTFGTPAWKDRVADVDAVPVARARAAGMAILGKTNLPELAASVGTSGPLFPPTQNPWRQGVTPGGSSGGSAAAVAAGMATVALGTDMGGSIRIPASCCGVVGLRPSPERIPSLVVDAAGLSSDSVVARAVADVRLLFAVAAGLAAPPATAPRRARIGVVEGGDAAPACREACHRAADALATAGHEVEAIQEWDWEPVAAGYAIVRRASVAAFPASLDQFGPGIRQLAAEGRSLSAVDYFQAFESAMAAVNRTVLGPLQTRFDFLLTPTLGLPPMAIEAVPAFLSGPWSQYIQYVLPVSFARVAAVSIPAGLHEGLPVGVQLVGGLSGEFELLELAEQLEGLPGFGFQRPPGMESADQGEVNR